MSLAIKRALDVVGAAVGLTMYFIVCYAMYGPRLKRETGASALFRQYRVGQNGRRFVLYKFRTMSHDAEERSGEPLRSPQLKDEGANVCVEHDPRVTRDSTPIKKSTPR